jgi:hypothetical protein
LPRTRLVREEHDVFLAQVDLPQQIEEDAEGRAGLGLTPAALCPIPRTTLPPRPDLLADARPGR